MAAHVEYGPSGLYRVLACPGSVNACRGIPEPPSNAAADTGTAVHAMIEICWREQTQASDLVGLTIEGIEVTDEMAAGAQVALDAYASLVEDGDLVWTEQRVDLASLNPPAPISGTSDFLHYRPSTGVLTSLDYKNGYRYVGVETPQVRAYALGAACFLAEMGHPVKEIRVGIIQPNAPGAAVRMETLSAMDLLDWSADLFAAVEKSRAPDAERIPGDHCTYCRAAPTCPPLRDHSLAVARSEFDAPTLPPHPDDLSVEEIGRILEQADIVETWLTAVRAHAHRLLDQGFEVPGWKLVQKRATRKWKNEATTADFLSNALREDDIYTKKIISPAQAEKLLGKDKKGLIEGLVIAESSGTTMAPASDKRPAVTGGAAAEFTLIEN